MTSDQPLSRVVVDLALYGGPVYAGRAAGEALRKMLGLDAADESGTLLSFVAPEGTYTVSSGFFLGLLGPSIQACGSETAFWERTQLNVPAFLREPLEGYVRAALATRIL